MKKQKIMHLHMKRPNLKLGLIYKFSYKYVKIFFSILSLISNIIEPHRYKWWSFTYYFYGKLDVKCFILKYLNWNIYTHSEFEHAFESNEIVAVCIFLNTGKLWAHWHFMYNSYKSTWFLHFHITLA